MMFFQLHMNTQAPLCSGMFRYHFWLLCAWSWWFGIEQNGNPWAPFKSSPHWEARRNQRLSGFHLTQLYDHIMFRVFPRWPGLFFLPTFTPTLLSAGRFPDADALITSFLLSLSYLLPLCPHPALPYFAFPTCKPSDGSCMWGFVFIMSMRGLKALLRALLCMLNDLLRSLASAPAAVLEWCWTCE